MVGHLPRPLVVLAAAVLASCGGSSKVGRDLTAEQGSSTSACRLGECTTTTAAPTSTTTTSVRSGTTRPPVTAPTTTKAPTPTPRPAAVFTVTIGNDQEGRPFEPQVASVSVGTTVRWTNTDSVPRSVESDNGAFSSPSIPPGGSFDYVATTKGRFAYHDGTRPYAVATLEVG